MDLESPSNYRKVLFRSPTLGPRSDPHRKTKAIFKFKEEDIALVQTLTCIYKERGKRITLTRAKLRQLNNKTVEVILYDTETTIHLSDDYDITPLEGKHTEQFTSSGQFLYPINT